MGIQTSAVYESLKNISIKNKGINIHLISTKGL